MYLTDLADAVRGGGLAVWESPGWRSRGHGGMAGVRGVLCHHTGGGGSSDWATVQNGRSDLAGPLAHMTLERDGGVRILAAGLCWHAGTGGPWRDVPRNNGNDWMVGIEGVSNGTAWTDAQRAAYPRLVAALLRHYGLPPDKFTFHRLWAPQRKVDPGNWDFSAFARDVAAAYGGRPAPTPTPAPVVPARPKELPEMIDRPLVKGPNVGTVIIPTGPKNRFVGEAWLSVRCAGGARVQLWFQASAPQDGPAPGVAKPIDWTLHSAERGVLRLPDGMDYVEYQIDAHGDGALAVELGPK